MAMPFYKLVLLFLFLNFLNCFITEAVTYIAHYCSPEKTFLGTVKLSTLFSYLTDNATGNTEFYNITVADKNPSDTLYGLFMCGGDVTPQLCHQCVNDATHRLISDSRCPISQEGTVWYEKCLVRYSNLSFFSTVDTTTQYYSLDDSSASNQATFMPQLFNTLNETADEAAKSPLGAKKFATKQANISGFQFLLSSSVHTRPLTSRLQKVSES